MSDSSPTWPPSPQTVTDAIAGDRPALTLILTAAHPRLVGFFRGAGPQIADAHDLTSHTLEAVVTSLPKLRNPTAFEGWFWQIARFTLRGWIRKTRRPTRYEKEYPAHAAPDERLEQAEEHSQMREALDQLNDKDRQLVWLREVEGLSYEDIGGRVGATIGTVRVACHRARKRLEDAYRSLEPSEDGL